MMMRILAGGLVGGLAGGTIVAAIQSISTTPLILHAETFEDMAQAGLLVLAHSHAPEATAGGGFDLMRTALTTVATIVVATGYAWMLLAAMTARGTTITARSVIPWAAAGFVVTGLAPAFGLPPELPGSAAADLVARQVWWFGTAAATAAGLAAIAFGRGRLWIVAGIALIALPHLIGAPHAGEPASRVPAEVAAHFVAASLVVQALIWLLPGAIAGFAVSRLKAA